MKIKSITILFDHKYLLISKEPRFSLTIAYVTYALPFSYKVSLTLSLPFSQETLVRPLRHTIIIVKLIIIAASHSGKGFHLFGKTDAEVQILKSWLIVKIFS